MNLAPNGKPSNLTPEQYNLVRTSAFKKWFGDWENSPETASKVVDENGEPLVVYHGTYVENPFYIFDFNKADIGFHFGTYEQAKNRSETKLFFKNHKSIINSFFLNIKKVYEVTDIGEWEYPQRYLDMFMSDNLISEIDAKKLCFLRMYDKSENVKIRKYLLQKNGNQIGFEYNNKYEGKGKSFIVLEPNQIKLADGTNTTFDGNNPDIRYADGGSINLAPVLEKFNSSKLYDISFDGLKSDNGFKISIVGKTMEDVYDLYNRLHEYLIKHNIAHKIATKKRVESNIKEQNRKLVTIYVPNDKDINKLLFKIEYLLKGYNGWQDIRLPHKGYEVYSGGISFRNDRDDYGNYIPAKILEKGGLIAPNGQPSKLTPEQYKLVRTPEFKAWFGDWENESSCQPYVYSQLEVKPKNMLLDENSEPQVFYHGSDDFGFTIVNVHGSSEQSLFWITTSKEMAERFTGSKKFGYKNEQEYFEKEGKVGGVYSFFVKTNKIFDIFNYNQVEEVSQKLADLIKLNKKYIYNGREIGARDFYSDWNKRDYIAWWSSKDWNDVESWEKDMWIIGMLKELGYDCITNKEGGVINIGFIGNPNQIKLADGSNTTFDTNNPDIRYADGGGLSKTPAPKSERIYGSKTNKPKSSASSSSAKSIDFSEETLQKIKNNIAKHNENYPNKKITLPVAKAVVRRGMGAYSSTHRPTISGGKPNSRVAWGLARLNAFAYKIINGKSKSGKYNQDDDLIKELHVYRYGGTTVNWQYSIGGL